MVIIAGSGGGSGPSARSLDCLIYPEHKESPVSFGGVGGVEKMHLST